MSDTAAGDTAPNSIGSKSSSNNSVVQRGWLVKEGSMRKSWKLRFFTLEHGRLRYWLNDSETSVKGTIEMKAAKVDVVEGVHWVQSFGDNLDTDAGKAEYGNRLTLHFVTAGKAKTMNLAASSEAEQLAWAEALRYSAVMEAYLEECAEASAAVFDEVKTAFAERATSLAIGTATEMDEQALNALAELLRLEQNPFTELAFRDISFAGISLATVARAIGSNKRIVRLAFNACTLPTLILSDLCSSLALNISLRDLSLSACSLGDDDATFLAKVVKENGSLESLDLSKNSLGPAGIELVAAALPDNKALRTLDLSENPLGDAGALAVGTPLADCQTLRALRMAACGISSVGSRALAAAVVGTEGMVEIDLSGNDIDADAAKLWATAMANQPDLERLDLSRCNLDKAAIGAIAPLASADGLHCSRLTLIRSVGK